MSETYAIEPGAVWLVDWPHCLTRPGWEETFWASRDDLWCDWRWEG